MSRDHERALVLAEAWCEDCDWSADANPFPKRVAQAQRHAKTTGHEVRGETGHTFVYRRPSAATGSAVADLMAALEET